MCRRHRRSSTSIEVRTPDGRQLINPLDLRLEVGDTLVVTGQSGSGKTTLLRSLAELWPFTSGTLTRPCGPNETMFLSQMPYVPLGDLRAVVSYPCEVETLDDSDLRDVLRRVALPHLVDRLDEVQDWAKVLSPGEQQRIAFARILLTKPKAVFLDESTSALDEGLEMMLYELVRSELPETILVSVSHRKTVEQHHDKELRLLGDGEWRLDRHRGRGRRRRAVRTAVTRPDAGNFPGMEMFTQSLDWGNEIAASLIWVAKGWTISALSAVVVLALVARFTTWGRQFWHVTGSYFTGRASVPVWALLGVLLLSVMISVRMDVLFSYYANDQFSALQTAFEGAGAGNDAVRDSGIAGFWTSIVIFVLLVTADLTRTLLDLYLMQYFIIRWRVWLTDRLTDDWLEDRAYYRGRFLAAFGGAPIDNPDQRIQQDIDVFTTGTGPETNTPTVGTSQTLLFGTVYSFVSVVAFTPILWNLAGPLTLLGVTVPKALFWFALLYVAVTTVVAIWIGRPIIRLTFRNELTNAAFRYALVRVRDAAEAVGFYRGERTERATLAELFARVIANYRRLVLRGVAFLGWNRSVSQLVDPLPLIVQAPRLFAGELTLGDVTQSSSAFASVQNSLSFFRAVYDAFAGYRAAIIRLDGLVTANEQSRALPRLAVEVSGAGVEFADLEVSAPDGELLVDDLDVALAPGDSLVITGRSGTGKTTLLRSLAQMWPYTAGTVRLPADGDAMFLSQLPYAPLGDLRAVVCYPSARDAFGDAEIGEALDAVTLSHLTGRLDEEADWSKVLSPGEQQRVAFARVLLAKPRAVFLDESTSALDEGQEYALYAAVRRELPECVVVSVSHRPSLERHHRRRLELLGDGEWRLSPLADVPG